MGSQPNDPELLEIPGTEGVAVDWTVHGDNAGTPTKGNRGPRSAVVELASYGRVAADWLEELPHFLARHPDVCAGLKAAGVVVVNTGAVVDLSALLDTDTEARALRTIGVAYESVGTPFDVVEFQYGELDLSVSSTTGPGSVTLDVVLDPDDPFC